MNKLVRNERRKLSATYVNGIAIALIAVGGFGTIANITQSGTAAPWSAILFAGCIFVSLGLHLGARRVLQGLEE